MRLAFGALATFAAFAGAGVNTALAAAEEFSRTLHPAAAQLPLAGALAEVSGLASAGQTSVYGHNDESATIFELDALSGEILRTVSLGRPAVIGDFEAIAAHGGVLSLITSKGVIYEAMNEPRRRSLGFRTFDTGLGRTCEIEGFTPTETGDAYLIACKRAQRRLVVYKWSLEAGAVKAVNMKLEDAVPNPKEFRAADIVRDQKTGTLLVLDSSAGAILEVSMTGEGVGYWRLGGKHPQAEGLALLADGRLLVADEGKIGRGSIRGGVLTLYPPRR